MKINRKETLRKQIPKSEQSYIINTIRPCEDCGEDFDSTQTDSWSKVGAFLCELCKQKITEDRACAECQSLYDDPYDETLIRKEKEEAKRKGWDFDPVKELPSVCRRFVDYDESGKRILRYICSWCALIAGVSDNFMERRGGLDNNPYVLYRLLRDLGQPDSQIALSTSLRTEEEQEVVKAAVSKRNWHFMQIPGADFNLPQKAGFNPSEYHVSFTSILTHVAENDQEPDYKPPIYRPYIRNPENPHKFYEVFRIRVRYKYSLMWLEANLRNLSRVDIMPMGGASLTSDVEWLKVLAGRILIWKPGHRLELESKRGPKPGLRKYADPIHFKKVLQFAYWDLYNQFHEDGASFRKPTDLEVAASMGISVDTLKARIEGFKVDYPPERPQKITSKKFFGINSERA